MNATEAMHNTRNEQRNDAMHASFPDIHHHQQQQLKKKCSRQGKKHRDSINIAAIPVAILCFQIMVQLAPNLTTLLAAVSAHVMRFFPVSGTSLESDDVKVAPTSSART